MNICLSLAWALWLRSAHPGFITPLTLATLLIATFVAFNPEGLPVCLSITLILSARRLAKQKILTRALASIHTLGMVSAIASDKTGTLTEGKMTVTSLFSPCFSKEPGESFPVELLQAAILSSQTDESGNAVDNAIMKFAQEQHLDVDFSIF